MLNENKVKQRKISEYKRQRKRQNYKDQSLWTAKSDHNLKDG